MDSVQNKLFDRITAAQFLGVSVVTLDRALAAKRLSHFRIGRRIKFSREQLEAFLRANEVRSKVAGANGG